MSIFSFSFDTVSKKAMILKDGMEVSNATGIWASKKWDNEKEWELTVQEASKNKDEDNGLVVETRTWTSASKNENLDQVSVAKQAFVNAFGN